MLGRSRYSGPVIETVAPRRPLVVSIAVVFVYITGLLGILVGILVLLTRYEVEGSDNVLAVSLIGAAIILLGLLVIAIASAIARGSRLARVILTVYLAIQIPLQGLAIASAEWDWIAIIQLAASAFTLVVLWLPLTNRFFRDSPQSRLS